MVIIRPFSLKDSCVIPAEETWETNLKTLFAQIEIISFPE